MNTSPDLPDRQQIVDEIRARLLESIAMLDAELKSISQGMAEDGKSSAGDKYETSREMAQQEHSRISKVLQQTQQHLRNISDQGEKPEIITSGSIVQTTSHIFYIGSAFGQMHLTSVSVFGIGNEAPVAKALHGLTAGKTFYLSQKEHTVKTIL